MSTGETREDGVELKPQHYPTQGAIELGIYIQAPIVHGLRAMLRSHCQSLALSACSLLLGTGMVIADRVRGRAGPLAVGATLTSSALQY